MTSGEASAKRLKKGLHGTEQALAARPSLGKAQALNSNLLFLPDLHSLNLLEGQLVP
jgi:hypothetical protein